MGQQSGGGQMMQSPATSYGGQYQQQSGGQFGSPQVGNNVTMQGASAAPPPGVGRYLPGYLTAASLSGVSAINTLSYNTRSGNEFGTQQSPRQNASTSNLDGRLSPEQSHRETGSSFGAGSSRLFASSTSSAGTAGRERCVVNPLNVSTSCPELTRLRVVNSAHLARLNNHSSHRLHMALQDL